MLEQVLLILLVLMSAAIIALLWMLAGGVRTRQIQRKLRNVSEMGSETEQKNLDE